MGNMIDKVCREYGTLLHVKKNTVLFRSDYRMETPYIYYLVDGICALTGNSYHGQEQVLLYFTAGNLIGINQFLDGFGSNLFSYSAPIGVTKTDCSLYRIPILEIKHLFDHDLEFNQYIIRVLSKHYHMTMAHLKQIQEDNSVTIICRFLLAMSEDKKEGRVLSKFFTYEEIARYLGIHMVTAGKIIIKLQHRGYVKRTPFGLLIQDENALKELVINCESFKY